MDGIRLEDAFDMPGQPEQQKGNPGQNTSGAWPGGSSGPESRWPGGSGGGGGSGSGSVWPGALGGGGGSGCPTGPPGGWPGAPSIGPGPQWGGGGPGGSPEPPGRWPGAPSTGPGPQWGGGGPGGSSGPAGGGQWGGGGLGGSSGPGMWPGAPGQGVGPGGPSGPAGGGQWGGVGPGGPSGPAGGGQWGGGGPGGSSRPGMWPGAPGRGVGPGGPSQQNLTLPYEQNLPDGVHDKLLTIAGTIKPNADRITVDLFKSSDIAFHFNPRFNEGGSQVIVRNSNIGGKWGKEERCAPCFPFVEGQPFEIKILCTNYEFKVAVNNSHLLEFKHRITDLTKINKLRICNDLSLSKVNVETLR